MIVNGKESDKAVIDMSVFPRELLENAFKNCEENKRKAALKKGNKTA